MVDYSGYKDMTFEKKGRVLTWTFNKPDVLNAMTEEMHEETSRAVYDIGMDHDVDVVVITGAGRAFSAGGDIGGMRKMLDEPTLFETSILEAKKIVFGLLDCEKILIAKVNGDAVGLGATIALFCDMIIAADHAQMGLINRAVPAEQLDEAVDAFVDKLNRGAMKSIKWTKTAVNIGLNQLAHSMMDTCMAYEALSNGTKDHAEAVEAFEQKRKPIFTGE